MILFFLVSATLVRSNCIWDPEAITAHIGTMIQRFPHQRFRTYVQIEGSKLDIAHCIDWLLAQIAFLFLPPLMTLMMIVSRTRLLCTLTFDIDVHCVTRTDVHITGEITACGCCGLRRARFCWNIACIHTYIHFLPAYMRTYLYVVQSCSFE